jgi:hypothetical protein
MTTEQLRLHAPRTPDLGSVGARVAAVVKRLAVDHRPVDRDTARALRDTSSQIAHLARLAGAGARAERSRIESRFAAP